MWSPAPKAANSHSTHASSPLFSPSLISPDVVSALPPKYTIRPLQRSDYQAGVLDVLRVLTNVGDITEEAWDERFSWMAKKEDEYHILVICNGEGKVVGTGGVVVERKLYVYESSQSEYERFLLNIGSIHNLGLVGHIEDIAVAKDQQGKHLGLHIIKALDYVAEKVGCYKTILDCSEPNEGFYVKCGYKRAGLQMAHYYGTASVKGGH